MTEVDSQASSASTVAYMEMGSEGNSDLKRPADDRGGRGGDGPSSAKKHKASDDSDWMEDGSLFTKAVKRKKQEAKSLNGEDSSKQSAAPNQNGTTESEDENQSKDRVETEDNGGTAGTSSNRKLEKIKSVQEDAEQIAELLEIPNVEAVYAKLRKVRTNPNRIDYVTNQLLEEDGEGDCEIIGVEDAQEKVCEIVDVVEPAKKAKQRYEAGNDDGDDVMQAMLNDIKEVCAKLKRRNPAVVFDMNAAYLLLESHLNKKNRVDIVVREMLPQESQSPTQENPASAYTEATQEESIDISSSGDGAKSVQKKEQKEYKKWEDAKTEKHSKDKDKNSEDAKTEKLIEDKNSEDAKSEKHMKDKDKKSEDAKHMKAKVPEDQNKDDNEETNILDEVGMIMKKYPDADANRVYALLECREGHRDRVQAVMSILKERLTNEPDDDTKTVSAKPAGVKRVLSESAVVDDPLYKDMLKIAKIFPHIDKNEIYALCEVHHDRSRRVELVTEELLKSSRGDEESQTITIDSPTKDGAKDSSSISDKQDGAGKKRPAPSGGGETSGATGDAPLSPLEELSQNVEQMKAIFPDCDPDYLYYMLEQRFADPERVQNLTAEMFERKNYPKLQERLEKEKRAANIRRIQKMEFKMDEFLHMFPDALRDFYDETKTVSEQYIQHADIRLKNMFPFMHVAHIKQVLSDHNSHLTPALRQLEREAAEYTPTDSQTGPRRRRPRGSAQKFRKNPRTTDTKMPDPPDEYFYKELMFTEHEQEIKDHLKDLEDRKRARLEEARNAGELHECTCCYDDEVLFEDMTSCPDGHLYCSECLRRSAESAIGEGKVKFPCFDENCEQEFAKGSLKKVLSSKIFSTLLRKVQEEEIRQADIPDLMSCPYCSFATIIPEDEPDKVFKCMNPECLKESCRLCKEPNHIPLRCNEVEKKGETDMRTFIENRITEAMIRTCRACKKRFFKTEGCNKMTCPCGATMCYVCQAPNIDYDHFNNGANGCPPDTDVRKLHLDEMEKAGKLAREKYERDHPEMSGQSLKYDPRKILKQAQKGNGDDWVAGADVGGYMGGYMGGDDVDEDDDNNSDVDSDYDISTDEDEDVHVTDGGRRTWWQFW